ncbi:MAG: hypothetical protein Q8O87_02860 [bacterium]|nr:hypothetical protein [bacterium]
MSHRFTPFNITILPRETMDWEGFLANTPEYSIALDGMVHGGPNYDPTTNHINFDHHSGVVREATMSTAMQVFFAIKGGLAKALARNGRIDANIYINDTDQDTAFAVWLLINYKKFEGTQNIPHINRLLALDDRWDITGGAFPMNLDDQLIRQHNWVFRPYAELRKSGGLASATPEIMLNNLEAVLSRLDKYLMGQAEETELDTRHEILHDSPQFKIVDEIGGNEARYYLFSNGMDAFISLVARRPDGRCVFSVGRRSRYIPFPVTKLYSDFNEAERLTPENGWNGSDIIGGSSRELGSGLAWEALRDIANDRLRKEGIIL